MSAGDAPGGEAVSAGERPGTLRIFMSYRRDDAGWARSLYAVLNEREQFEVFMDIEKIDAGRPWKDAIDEALGSCDVFLALIGPGWLDETARLQDPEDLVRYEIEGALARAEVRAVPVLLQDVKMPASEALPASLQGLRDRHAHELSHTGWDSDVEELVEDLDAVAAKKAAPLLSPRMKMVASGLAALVLVALAGVGIARLLDGGNGGEEETAARTTPTTTETPTQTQTEAPGNPPAESVGVPFPYAPENGTGNELPVELTFDDLLDDTIPDGAGFTGLMTDDQTSLEGLFLPGRVEVADGMLQIRATTGDPLNKSVSQRNAFQLGIRPPDGSFTVHVRLPEPFSDLSGLEAAQSMGLFIGTGDQSNYVKLVAGYLGVELLAEVGGVKRFRRLLGPRPFPLDQEAADLYLTIDAEAGAVTASFTVTDGENVSDPVRSEPMPLRVLPSWLGNPGGLAVGVISTTGKDGSPFNARWDLLEVVPGASP